MEVFTKDSGLLFGLFFKNDTYSEQEKKHILGQMPENYDDSRQVKLSLLVESLNQEKGIYWILQDDENHEVAAILLREFEPELKSATLDIFQNPLKHVTTLKKFFHLLPDIPELYSFIDKYPDISIYLAKILPGLIPFAPNLKKAQFLTHLAQSIGKLGEEHHSIIHPMIQELEAKEIELLNIASGSGAFSTIRTNLLLEELVDKKDQDTYQALLGLMCRNKEFPKVVANSDTCLEHLNNLFNSPPDFLFEIDIFKEMLSTIDHLKENGHLFLAKTLIDRQSQLLFKSISSPTYGKREKISSLLKEIKKCVVDEDEKKSFKDPLMNTLRQVQNHGEALLATWEIDPARAEYLINMIEIYLEFEELTNIIDYLDKFVAFFRDLERQDLQKQVIQLQASAFPKIMAARKNAPPSPE